MPNNQRLQLPPIPDFAAHLKTHLRRTEWKLFPDVIIHGEELTVKKHSRYAAAKAGDAVAAEALVRDIITIGALDEICTVLVAKRPYLLAVHALETEGMNVIPRVFSRTLANLLDLPVASSIIQINRVSHTGASGYARLAFPALFGGAVDEAEYFLVDDFIGQGGTLANLKGYVESQGATVTGGTTLTGKAYSAKLRLQDETLQTLRTKHGSELEQWWIATFGYSFEKLTESEARYLIRADNAHAISARIIAARGKRN
jgi:hypothetical protein